MTFKDRLRAVQQGGNLTIADLARWFQRPHPTVRSWVEHGRQPGGGPLDAAHIEALLKLLETVIRRKRGLPVPRLSPPKRIAYLKDLRETMLP